jgi:hypothetical protein
MAECPAGWCAAVGRAVARDLDVHVLAWNAGAKLIADGLPSFDEMVEFHRNFGQPVVAPGWAAWFAAGDELR